MNFESVGRGFEPLQARHLTRGSETEYLDHSAGADYRQSCLGSSTERNRFVGVRLNILQNVRVLKYQLSLDPPSYGAYFSYSQVKLLSGFLRKSPPAQECLSNCARLRTNILSRQGGLGSQGGRNPTSY